ncbi:MAG: cell division topological specificity factor MinE [Deltaproteobacteria bacterium]|nr:MAG: cell division topological specificity factor MinE [Deltaproteobacteria bacterium]
MKKGFFGKLFGVKKEPTKNIAKKRLQFALIYDKLEISDEILESLQKDIVGVISKYFEIDKDALKLDIERQDDLSALVLNTPIISAKRKKG